MGQPNKFYSLYKQIIKLRWMMPLVILAMAALHQFVLHQLLLVLPIEYHTLTGIMLYGITGSIVVWIALSWLAGNAARQEQTEVELLAAYESLSETHRRLLAVHDIGKEIASAAEMQQVLELAARAPSRLAGAKGSAVITFDKEGNKLNLDMAWGLSNDYLHGLRKRVEAGIPADRCEACSVLGAEVSGSCPLFQGMQDLAQQEGIQSLVCLPIIREEKREGIISAYFPSPDGPPEEQVQLLNIVTNEIATALDGARLRNNHLAAIYAVENLSQVEQNLDALLDQVLETSLSGWGVRGGAIMLYDEIGARWNRWVQRELGGNSSHPHFGLVLRLAEETRQSGQPILIPDLAKYPNTKAINGLRSAAAAPLISGGEQLGALVMVSRRKDLFQLRQIPFFSAIAHQTALAVRNARLHSQVQQMAVVEERYRLSREMHDGLAQTLSALGWQLDHLKTLLGRKDFAAMEQELSTTRQMTREAYMDVREAIDGLRLAIDHPGGLAGALEEYIADFQHRTNIEAGLQVDEAFPPLTAQTELQLLRIGQESLINARKHAAANNVLVRLQHNSDQIELTITDDGKGFDSELPRGRNHLGLTSMRERVQSLGGVLTLATSPSQGTRITVTVPTKDNLS